MRDGALAAEDGYTLLEMVVAIAIFSSVIFVASMALYSVQQTWRKVHAHNRRLDNLLKIDRVVEMCFRNIIPFSWKDVDDEDKRPVFLGDSNELVFACMHRITDNNFSAIRFVRLYQEDDDLVAEYRNSPILNWDRDDLGLTREVLASDIESVEFTYGDQAETGSLVWTGDWDEDNSGNYMPLAVQMRVRWKDGTVECWLRRTAGSGKYESFGVREKNDGLSAPEDADL